MNIYIYISGLVFSAGSIIAVIQWRLNRLEKDLEEENKNHKDVHTSIKNDGEEEYRKLWKVIGDIRTKVEDHEKDSSEIRLEIEKRLGVHDSSLNVNKAQYDEIIRQLAELRMQISEIQRVKN